jgi:hypothetical protein
MKTTLGILWLIAIATAGVAQSGGGYDLLLCETGQVELVSSDTLRYEVGQNPLLPAMTVCSAEPEEQPDGR